MPKRKIEVIYNPKFDKKELYSLAKDEIRSIYNSLVSNTLNKKQEDILKIFLKIDNKDSYFRILFLLSLYCNYFHKIKNKINVDKLTNLKDECYKKHNFVILDLSDIHKDILEDISIYFNTDSNNIENISGKILYDINSIDIQLKK